jgi:nucleoside-diphosphate kinase
MAVEQTLCIIKPDAFDRKDEIIQDIKSKGFSVLEQIDEHITQQEWRKFYSEHSEKAFFGDLIKHMSSGLVCILLLQKDSGISDLRSLIGATDPKKARKGSLRSKYGTVSPKNAVHGSDSEESAKVEIEMFFGKTK